MYLFFVLHKTCRTSIIVTVLGWGIYKYMNTSGGYEASHSGKRPLRYEPNKWFFARSPSRNTTSNRMFVISLTILSLLHALSNRVFSRLVNCWIHACLSMITVSEETEIMLDRNFDSCNVLLLNIMIIVT